MKKHIGIQGIQGSYHHQVALSYFGENITIDPCLSFKELVDNIVNGVSTDAVMAIENSIAGSIIPNYAYIDDHDLIICGEYYLPIHHCLMALEGQSISDIKEVYSHPMALLQCKDFFRKNPHIKLVEDIDTAEVAKRISEQKLKGIAAIASSIAADIFGLQILAREIQTIKNNSTRFFVISNSKTKLTALENANKASLKFVLDHKQGSLAAVLNALSHCGLDLTKIQSLPVIETPWQYAFFVDVTFTQAKDYLKAIQLLEMMTTHLKVLGLYKKHNIL